MGGPLLIVTGAAGSGKTTATDAIASRVPGVVSIDGDVIGAGAAAVAGDRRDYVGFWAYITSIAAQIAANGLTPLIGCVMRPEQLLENDLAPFSRVDFLAMLCADDVRRERILGRGGNEDGLALASEAFADHSGIDARLRALGVPSPHTITTLDTAPLDAEGVRESACSWAIDRVDM